MYILMSRPLGIVMKLHRIFHRNHICICVFHRSRIMLTFRLLTVEEIRRVFQDNYTTRRTGVLTGYTVFSMSEIPSFCQHLRFLLCNFDNFRPMLHKFTPHHNHHTMHVLEKLGLKV